MPHITKFKDKTASDMLDDYLQGRKLSDLIDVTAGFDKDGHIRMTYDEAKLSDIVSEILDKYRNDEEFFDRFVEVKEVPYGERNINTDY